MGAKNTPPLCEVLFRIGGVGGQSFQPPQPSTILWRWRNLGPVSEALAKKKAGGSSVRPPPFLIVVSQESGNSSQVPPGLLRMV